MSGLIDRQPLWTWRDQLNSSSVRHLEPVADVPPTCRDLRDRLLEIRDPKDQDRLITSQVLGEQQAGESAVNRTMATRVPNRSMAKTGSAPKEWT
jgi:hypothetical protein